MSEPFIARIDARKLDEASRKTGIPIDRLRLAKEGKVRLTGDEEKSLQKFARELLP